MQKGGLLALTNTIMNKPKQLTFPWSRANKSCFENFYVDPKNSLLLSIISNKILSDDIYIFGINNSGKTYLLQSLCNFYSKHNKTALFLPIKEVISHGVGILDSIENSDLICLDGLENIIANEEWEIAIFNLINNTLNNQCRLVFASSIESSNNIFSLPDLDSRIKKLQSYELYPIDDANLLHALKHIANLSSINLGEREAHYLLTYSKRNISDLVSILESLDQLSMEKKKRISIPLIKEII
jgi:DnaA family protein